MKSKPFNISQAINKAATYHKEGRLYEAEKLCQQVLRREPDNADANNILGVIARSGGNNELAVQFIAKAIRKNPRNAFYYFNLGNTFKAQGKLDDAISAYRKATGINPKLHEAYHNLGTVLQEQGLYDEAVRYYNKALTLKPDYPQVYNNLGAVFQEQGLYEEAVQNFQKAIALKSDYYEAYNNMGFSFKERGLPKEAISCYQKALHLKADFPKAYLNLGLALLDVGLFEHAVVSFERALACNLKPDAVAEAHNNIGLALQKLNFLDRAIASYQKALTIKPDFSVAHSNFLYALHYHPATTQEYIYSESLKWNDQHVGNIPDANRRDHPQRVIKDRRLRIGYVSPDFRNHSVNYFFEPFLKEHNRDKFEIYLYSNVKRPDQATRRLQTEADHWVPVAGLKDKEVVEQIRKDRIDILVDLAGHTANNRLLVFGYRPAPVQVTWLGYPNTTGMNAIDYRFVDNITDPVGYLDDLHTEELVRLPHGFFCFQPTADAPEVSDSPLKKTGCITFGSLNNLGKISADVIALWAEILQKVPNSRLLMLAKSFSTESGKKRYREIFAMHGIKENRLELIPPVTHAGFLALLGSIDIALDPFPYNGQTATSHTLWMGVPVMTLRGKHHVARVGASILTRIGLEGLIAENREEYLDKTVTLAQDPERLSSLRREMRGRMQASPFCDAKGFAEGVENEYGKCGKDFVQNNIKIVWPVKLPVMSEK